MSKKLVTLTALGSLMLLLTIQGCYYDNAEDLYPGEISCDPDREYAYAGNVELILETNCATTNCHAAGNANRQPLTTYDEVVNAIENYDLQRRVEDGSMPPGGSLSESDECNIINWIESGYPNNR